MPIPDRSSDLSAIAVNTNIPQDSVDCGIRVLGWCRGPSCQKYARLRSFVIVLACAGLLQGACETYFRISAKQAALEHEWNPLVVEWLLVSSGIFQAIFALAFAYWAHRMHPISWLGGVVILQGITCIVAMIPSIMNFADGLRFQNSADDENICATSLQSGKILSVQNSNMLILAMMFILQFALGLASLAFYTVGITYIDDNSPSIDSAAVIATAFGAKLVGFQGGFFLVMGVGAIGLGWWLGWVILGPLVLTSGILLGLFPKQLPKTVIHQAAQRIIEESRSRQFGSQFATYIDDIAFWPSLKRIFGNKLLMFNIVSIMFIQSATINYSLQEENYLQSRFYLPFSEEDGLSQEWQARFMSLFIKPTVAGVSMLIGGLLISKLKLTGRKIAAINMGMCIKLFIIYIIYIFIKCDVGPIAGVKNGKIEQPGCSRNCICTPTSFLPVCPENSTVTYFAPCYAGCTRISSINNIEIYEGCSCGGTNNYEMDLTNSKRATLGACSSENCFKMLLAFQLLSLSTGVVYGMTTIGKIIISLRSVLPQDKGLALAMEVMCLGFFAYVPVHLAYDVVSRVTCVYWAPNYTQCLLRETPKHGNILNILSACLIFVGLIFDILVFIFIKGLNIYNCKVTDLNYTPSLYSAVPQGDPTHTPMSVSPVTTSTIATIPGPRPQPQPTRHAPNPEITVFRQPSTLTNSSAGDSSIIEPPTNGVTYAQVVFPPDKRKPNDGSASPKRMAVRADVPLHHLSNDDVRAPLSNLKSFTPNKATDVEPGSTGAIPKQKLLETNLDDIRPQSPETDF
ncbi:solute carrier organic anion transporter family member 1A5 [Stomoxys calcitrans]|uniref:solute carrier organic anion transporter family member 1A5 n=1 Tax=Stomoxys calcitrans TaxID=35570 RepID=UPI0027E2B657|nr:solute carrier organic anion transporter family member 1A5 [Stomoxys calcitrans]